MIKYNKESDAVAASQAVINGISANETNTALAVPTMEFFSIIIPNSLLECYNAADDETKLKYVDAYKTAITSTDFETTFTNIVASW